MTPNSGAPPQPSVVPAELMVEAPGLSLVTPLVVVNRGGGRLAAEVVADQPWVRIPHPFIHENQVKLEVELLLDQLPLEQAAHATITLRFGSLALHVPVTAVRYGPARAVRLYQEGQMNAVKDVCRKLISADPGDASAPLLLAAVYLDDRNFPSALRVLQDLPRHASDRETAPRDDREGLPDEVFESILINLERHPNSLRNLEQGIPIFERMHAIAGPGVHAHVREALRLAYLAYLKDHVEEPRVGLRDEDEVGYPRAGGLAPERSGIQPADSRLDQTSSDEIRRLLGYARRARRYFPGDGTLAGIGQVLEDILNLRERTARARVALIALIALAAAVGVGGLFYLAHGMRLNGARSALARGDYPTAVSNATAAMAWSLDRGEARRLRAQASFEWARSLFDRDEPDDGLYRINAALRDDPGNQVYQRARREELSHWAGRLLRQGRFNQAYEKYLLILAMGMKDAALQRRVASLAPWAEVARLLESAEGSMEIHPRRRGSLAPPLELRPALRPPSWMTIMRERGLTAYNRRLQIAQADLHGDGISEMVIAGCDWPGPGARSGLVIYRPTVRESADGGLHISYQPRLVLDGGQDRYFSDLKLQRLDLGPPTGRLVMAATWLRQEGSPLGHSVFVWGSASHLRTWQPANTDFPVDVRDQDKDGRPELWVRRPVGDRKDPDTLVGLPIPYHWLGGGSVQEVSQDFSDFYLDDLIPDLERQRRTRFRLDDPRRARYDAHCEKAIRMARALAEK